MGTTQSHVAHARSVIDDLTLLPNRRGWEETLEAEAARGPAAAPFTVLLVDLDGLRQVRASEGQRPVNEILRQAGTALAWASVAAGVAARVDDRSFGVLMPGCDRDAARRIKRRVEQAMASVGAPASIGLATGDLDEDPRSVWRRVEAAREDERGRGRGSVALHGRHLTAPDPHARYRLIAAP